MKPFGIKSDFKVGDRVIYIQRMHHPKFVTRLQTGDDGITGYVRGTVFETNVNDGIRFKPDESEPMYEIYKTKIKNKEFTSWPWIFHMNIKPDIQATREEQLKQLGI